MIDWFSAQDQAHIQKALEECCLPKFPPKELELLKLVESVGDEESLNKIRQILLAKNDQTAEYLAAALSHYKYMTNNLDKFGQPDTLEAWNVMNVVNPILDKIIQDIPHMVFHRLFLNTQSCPTRGLSTTKKRTALEFLKTLTVNIMRVLLW